MKRQLRRLLRPRIFLLTFTLYFAHAIVLAVAPEPCWAEYPVWRASLRWGGAGVWYRDLGAVKSGLAACDLRYR